VAADPGPPRLDWARDGHDWPHRASSRFVQSGGLRWHLQVFGPPPDRVPTVLLLHGTGAASHSWRGLAPLLAGSFHVVAPDLPGHGFSGMPPPRGLSLPGMAAAVGALLRTLQLSPALVVGHSAGAAVGTRLLLDGGCPARGLVGLNGAWLPFGGLPGQFFSPAARLLAGLGNATPARLFARLAAHGPVLDRLLTGTGSSIDPAGRRCYARLAANPGHVAGALTMMAHWELRPLVRDLPRLSTSLLMIVGTHDKTVPPSQSAHVARLVPQASLLSLEGLGHLAHEERPQPVADAIAALAGRLRLPGIAGVC
jgi:magnesium chelatase accessory protein